MSLLLRQLPRRGHKLQQSDHLSRIQTRDVDEVHEAHLEMNIDTRGVKGEQAGLLVPPSSTHPFHFVLSFFPSVCYLIIKIKFVNLCLPPRSVSLTARSHLVQLGIRGRRERNHRTDEIQ